MSDEKIGLDTTTGQDDKVLEVLSKNMEDLNDRKAMERMLVRKVDLKMSILILLYVMNYVSTSSIKYYEPRLTVISYSRSTVTIFRKRCPRS
jgi:hypothetical protein